MSKLSAVDLATRYRVSRDSILRWHRLGKLPAAIPSPGLKLFWDESVIEAWEKSGDYEPFDDAVQAQRYRDLTAGVVRGDGMHANRPVESRIDLLLRRVEKVEATLDRTVARLDVLGQGREFLTETSDSE